MLSDTDFAENHSVEWKTDFYSDSCMDFFFANFSLLPKATCFPISFMNEFTCLICLGDFFNSTDRYIIEISEVDRQLQSAAILLLTSKSDNFLIGNYPIHCTN